MTKICANCGKELKENSDVCQECGASVKNKQSNEKKKMPTWLIIVLAVFGLIIIAGVFYKITDSNASQSDSDTNTNTNSTIKKEDLTLEDGHHGYLDDSGFAYYIEGYITNNGNKEYSYVQITFNSYDSEGNLLGSCLDNVNKLDANGRWNFKAMCVSEAKNIASYKLDKIIKW